MTQQELKTDVANKIAGAQARKLNADLLVLRHEYDGVDVWGGGSTIIPWNDPPPERDLNKPYNMHHFARYRFVETNDEMGYPGYKAAKVSLPSR